MFVLFFFPLKFLNKTFPFTISDKFMLQKRMPSTE